MTVLREGPKLTEVPIVSRASVPCSRCFEYKSVGPIPELTSRVGRNRRCSKGLYSAVRLFCSWSNSGP